MHDTSGAKSPETTSYEGGADSIEEPQKAIGEEEKNKKDKDSGKDPWDKFATLSTLLSTVLIAVVGGYFTHSFEERQAAEQKKIQETQAVAQLMPYLTSDNKNTKRSAFIAVKVLGNASLMVDLAKSDLESEGAREALRDLKAHGALKEDRDLAIAALAPYEFAPYCELPFREVAVSHDDIDMTCGMWGKLTSPDATRTQNLVKNNFCSGTQYRDMTLADFLHIQQQADSVIGNRSANIVPLDRSAFRDIGEGSAVQFTGYIMNAHYADTATGESVNCNLPGTEANDIHVSLGNKPDETDECQSITAEISPHGRPAKWEVPALAELTNEKMLVRIGGQLMFDASHIPCRSGSRTTGPRRLSTWEIHPVYSIEICTKPQGNSCREENWTPLAKPPHEN